MLRYQGGDLILAEASASRLMVLSRAVGNANMLSICTHVCRLSRHIGSDRQMAIHEACAIVPLVRSCTHHAKRTPPSLGVASYPSRSFRIRSLAVVETLEGTSKRVRICCGGQCTKLNLRYLLREMQRTVGQGERRPHYTR